MMENNRKLDRVLSTPTATQTTRARDNQKCVIKLTLVPNATHTLPKDLSGDSFDFSVPTEVHNSDSIARSAVMRKVSSRPKLSLGYSLKGTVSIGTNRLRQLRLLEEISSDDRNLSRNIVNSTSQVSDMSMSLQRLNSSIGPKISSQRIARVNLLERKVEPFLVKRDISSQQLDGVSASGSPVTFGLLRMKTLKPMLSKIEGNEVASRSVLCQTLEGQSHEVTVITWNNGSVYEGGVKGDCFHGRGHFRHFSGFSVKGTFVDGQIQGRAEYKHAGMTYTGDWVAGTTHGKGLEVQQGVYEYEGDFNKGFKTGQGRLEIIGKGTYTGQFKFNSFCGRGFFEWKDGRLYVGQWKDGKMHGKGQMKWPDGRKYEGQYCNNKKEGSGTFKWADGRLFTGLWKNGQQHGLGKYTDLDKFKSGGDWRKGLYNGSEPETGNLLSPLSQGRKFELERQQNKIA